MLKKKCSRCQKVKSLSDFFKDKSRTDGLSYICKLCDQEKYKIWKKNNYSKYKENNLKWKEKNKEKLLETGRKNAKKYRLKHKEKIRKRKNEYEKRKMKEDIFFRNKKLIRKRINNAFRNKKCNKKTEKIIGCSIQEYVSYIESKFKPGMSWENQNLWEIDHIIPICSAKTREEQEKLFHYSNVQPLWKSQHKQKTKDDLTKYSIYHNKNLNQ